MRILLALIVAATLVLQPGASRAMDLREAAMRLATIDSELTDCLRVRMLVAVIVVRELRDCITSQRPGERSLRGDLNDWISTLAGQDPDRGDALQVRQLLNAYRGFMNLLDGQMRLSAGTVERTVVAQALISACPILLRDSVDGLPGMRADLELPEFCAQH